MKRGQPLKPGPKTAGPAMFQGLPPLTAPTLAGRVLEFFRTHLRHIKGEQAGQPMDLDPWQIHQVIEPAFNTLDADGNRQYRTIYLTVPRKNGKSTLGAGLALYLLYYDGEPGADIISAAADREQAAVVLNVAREMVEQSPSLSAVTAIYRRELYVPATASSYRVVSSEAYSKHGLNLHGAIIDELHAHPDRRLYDVLTTSSGSRRQPFVFIITTAGSDEHSIAAEVHRYAEKVRDGIVPDPSFLPVIYAAPPDADVWDEEVWQACNPALTSGFRSLNEMRTAARQAKEIPGREQAFRQLYLNQWGTTAASRWLSLNAWDACASAAPLPEGRAFMGLDLSATTDLSALVLLIPDADGGFDVRAEFWCPEERLQERARTDRVPYPVWVQQGHLTATPGNSVDYTFIEARIMAIMAEREIAVVAVDPWNARELTGRLAQNGVPIVEVAQTLPNLTSGAKALETLILSRKLRHNGQPILRWNISNAVADVDGNGNVKPSKKRSHERIDGVSALVTALSRAIVDGGESVYGSRGVLVL